MTGHVALIGLGNMGLALGLALQKAGVDVVGWTRSEGRRRSVREKIRVADTLDAALDDSRLAILCVSDFAASLNVLDEIRSAGLLGGGVLVHLTSETPDQAREFSSLAADAGVTVLDGAIATLPAGIGRDQAVIYYSGPAEAFRDNEPVLKALAGKPIYCGDDLGAASAMDMAWLALFFPTCMGFVNAASICQAWGLDTGLFLESTPSYLEEFRDLAADISKQVQSGTYTGDQATLKVHAAALEQVVLFSERLGVDARLQRVAFELMGRAIDEGFGDEELSAITKIFPTG